jgi:hypothetical protein
MWMGRWNQSGNLISGLDGRGKLLSHFSLSTFTFSAPLLLSAFALSVCLLLLVGAAMDHVKTTVVPVDPEDSADLEIVYAFISDDVAETSSAFNQDARENAPLKGREDRESFDVEPEDDDDMDDQETSTMKMLILMSQP